MKIILCILSILYLSRVSNAQGKVYIIPTIGFYSGSYRGVDSINDKQAYINAKPFLWKQFIYGVRIQYSKNSLALSFGLENGVYASGYEHFEDNSNPFRVVSRESTAEGSFLTLFSEIKSEVLNLNIKKLSKKMEVSASEKKYLLVSTIAPLLGFEFRKMGDYFSQDYLRSSQIITYQGVIYGDRIFHLNRRNQFSMRAGLDWTFYDGEKRKFLINFIYSFAFNDAGYFNYTFYPNNAPPFKFKTITRGNGFSLKAGVPIGIFKKKKK